MLGIIQFEFLLSPGTPRVDPALRARASSLCGNSSRSVQCEGGQRRPGTGTRVNWVECANKGLGFPKGLPAPLIFIRFMLCFFESIEQLPDCRCLCSEGSGCYRVLRWIQYPARHRKFHHCNQQPPDRTFHMRDRLVHSCRHRPSWHK